MNLFLLYPISSTFFGPRTIVFNSLSSNNILYGGLLPTVVVANDARLLN